MNIVHYLPFKVYCFDPFGKPIIKDITNKNSHKSLVFYINDNHIYPVLDDDVKNSIIK